MALQADWNGRLRTITYVVVVAMAVRLLMVWLIPPLTDVYYYHTQAVEALLAGSNPYGHLYTGIPARLATPGAERVYAYLPGVFLFLAPFGALSDIRLGLITADVVVALGLYSLKGRWSVTAAAVFLFAPWSFLFATFSPNSSLPAMAFLGLAILWEARGRTVPSAIFLGVSLAASQFVWLVYPFFLLLYARRGSLRGACVSLLVTALIVLPFLLWNPQSFVYDTITFQFTRPVQAVLTAGPLGYSVDPTLSGIAYALLGVSVPFVLKAGITLVLLFFLLRRSKDFESMTLNASLFVLTAILVLPDVFSTCYLELPFQLALTWVVLTWRGPQPDAEESLPTLKERS